MSEENVGVVRGYLREFGARTPEEIGEWAEEFWDPDGDSYPVRNFPESHPCHGREEITRFMADFHAAYERFEFEVNELLPVGEDRVLAKVVLSAEGRRSGVRLAGDIHGCFWLGHRQIFREEDHLTVAGALRSFGLEGDSFEAAGLRDEPPSTETSGG